VRTTFVADASVTIAWVHPAQATTETEAMLDALADGAALEVPALWPLEVANALLVLVRRRKLAPDERTTALDWLRLLPAKIDHEAATLGFSRLSELADLHQLSVYDAAYLELVLRRRLPLACNDGPLRQAAKRAGVELWSS
jgi:predicted nucleic acid-binding protein